MKIKQFIRKQSSYTVVQLLMTVAAVLCIFFGKDNAVILSIACSVLASAIVGLFTVFFLFQEDENKEIVKHWGLTNIYRSRSEMNKDCDVDLNKAREHVDYVGFGFRSLRDTKDDDVRQKVSQGVKFRFLVMDPESPFLKEREKEESCAPDEIRKSIKDLEKWVRNINEKNRDNPVELKYYSSLPLDYYNRIDNVVYMGPYWYGKTSQHTVSYKFTADSEGFNLYTEYFEKLWKDSDLSRDALISPKKRK